MQTKVDIGYDQLVQLVKQLPFAQWQKLKLEIEKHEPGKDKERDDFRKLLLNGPIFTQEQLDTIAETRKRIDEWRTEPL